MIVKLLRQVGKLQVGVHDLDSDLAKRLISEGKATVVKERENATDKKAHDALQNQVDRSGSNKR